MNNSTIIYLEPVNINLVNFSEKLDGHILNVNDIEISESKVLGSGEYGNVFQGFYKPKGEQVAVKVAKKCVHEIFEEALIGAKLKGHPNVIELYGVVLTNFLQLIYQYMDQGDLSSLLKRRSVKLKTGMCLDFMKQIALGLEFIQV